MTLQDDFEFVNMFTPQVGSLVELSTIERLTALAALDEVPCCYVVGEVEYNDGIGLAPVANGIYPVLEQAKKRVLSRMSLVNLPESDDAAFLETFKGAAATGVALGVESVRRMMALSGDTTTNPAVIGEVSKEGEIVLGAAYSQFLNRAEAKESLKRKSREESLTASAAALVVTLREVANGIIDGKLTLKDARKALSELAK